MNISPRDLRLLEVYEKITVKDLEVNLEEYHKLLDTLIYLHETLVDLKIKFPIWEKYSDTLMTKFYLHSGSVYNILCGREVTSGYFGNKLNKKIIDTPTANIVLRAQLETFLMYNHIYVNPSTPEEQEFRFNAWMYSSLKERQDYPASSSDTLKRKAEDLRDLETFKGLISSSSFYSELSIKQQNKLLIKGDARLFKSWKEIIEETGFGKDHMITTYYSYLSGYAHSEGISILQIRDSQLGYNKFHQDAHNTLFVSKLIVCLMILIIKEKFKVVNIKYNTLPQNLQDTIEIYCKIAKEFSLD